MKKAIINFLIKLKKIVIEDMTLTLDQFQFLFIFFWADIKD